MGVASRTTDDEAAGRPDAVRAGRLRDRRRCRGAREDASEGGEEAHRVASRVASRGAVVELGQDGPRSRGSLVQHGAMPQSLVTCVKVNCGTAITVPVA